ncbi:MAG: hypothetical protein IJ852_03825 [Alphaproteobacteria bacterium]|nr:hypothetical protein [Alphaproteobacteria bacterium]
MKNKSVMSWLLARLKKSRSIGKKSLSRKQAAEMQKKYIADNCSVDDIALMPYQEILAQLARPQVEISLAALYYLEKIAQNHASVRAEILRGLRRFQNEKVPSETLREALEACIERIARI